MPRHHTLPLAQPNLANIYNGLAGWAYDPSAATNQSGLVAGQMHLIKVYVPRASTISNFVVRTSGTAGTAMTNSFMGLYDTSGALLGQTADLSASWNGATGNKTHALSASVAVAPGSYYVGFLTGSFTTSANFSRSTSVDVHNANLSAGTYRACLGAATGLTALPSSITMGTTTSLTNMLWCGVA